MRTAPTAAMEALLNIEPLHVHIETVVQTVVSETMSIRNVN